MARSKAADDITQSPVDEPKPNGRGLADIIAEFKRELRNEQITAFKTRRVIDAGNVFPENPSDYGPFAPMPAVLRAFIFKVLTAPELRAYLHIVCFAHGFRIERVSGSDIRRDVGLEGKRAIYTHANRLVELGFLLRTKQGIRHNDPRSVNFFQRPSLEYTLLCLLQAEEINSYLMARRTPNTKPVLREHLAVHGELIRATLEHMIGTKYDEIMMQTREDRRRSQLITELQAAVERVRLKHNEASAKRNRKRNAKRSQARAKGS